MKKCPTCKMTVKADMACPICQTTLTYEPEVSGNFEKKKLNKYLGIYLLKRFAFVLAAIAFCIVAGLFIQKESYWLATIVTGVASLLITILQRTLTMYVEIPAIESFLWTIIFAIKYVALLIPLCWGILYLIFN